MTNETNLDLAAIEAAKTLQVTPPEPEEGAFYLLLLAHQELVQAAYRFSAMKFKTKTASNEVSEKTMAALMCFDLYLPYLIKEREKENAERDALLARLRELEEAARWRSVKEELPEFGSKIIVASARKVYLLGCYAPRGWPVGFWDISGQKWFPITATHWMYPPTLSAPPTQEQP